MQKLPKVSIMQSSMLKFVIGMLLLMLITISNSFAFSDFESRKQTYLDRASQGRYDNNEYAGYCRWLWGWLHLNNNGQFNSLINEEIDDMFESGDLGGGNYDPWYHYNTAYRPATLMAMLTLYWDNMPEISRSRILDRMPQSLGRWPTNPNQQINTIVGNYLYCRDYATNRTDIYAAEHATHWFDFQIHDPLTNQTVSYTRGNSYNTVNLTYHWLLYVMDFLAKLPHSAKFTSEIDSNYMSSYLNALLLLVETAGNSAQDLELKRRAEMIIDLLILDAGMDAKINDNGVQTGGQINRHYPTSQIRGDTEFLWDFLWDTNLDAVPRVPYFWYVYLGSWRPKEMIIDLTDQRDENEQYYHIHTETSFSHGTAHGKWNMVTKNWSLGGGVASWQLVINSNEGVPFKIWINSQQKLYSGSGEAKPPFGEGGYLYKNAALIHINTSPNTTYLHEIIGSHSWDEKSTESGWRFFREGNTAVAIQLLNENAGLQVVNLGADYPPYSFSTYNAFKTAVKNTCSLSGGNGAFTNTSGEVISWVMDSDNVRKTRVDGRIVYPGEFDRMETIDHNGAKLIDWNNNVMTVSHHGTRLTYDFNNWQISGNNFDYNYPPTVTTGSDVTIQLSNATAALAGTVTDDGLPASGSLSYAWRLSSGPQSALISDPNNLNTSVSFSEIGDYTFTLQASDGELTATNRMHVFVQDGSGNTSPTNIALNQPATASSMENTIIAPELAFDDNVNTRWGSAWGNNNEWLQVDLGSRHTISRIVLNWEFSFARQYNLEISNDGSTWSIVHSETAGDGGIDEINLPNGIQARYIRIQGIERARQEYGYSLFEFAVYGTPADSSSSDSNPPEKPKGLQIKTE